MDMLRAQTDALKASNIAGTGSISHRDDRSTYLGTENVKHDIDEMDSLGGHVDASNGQTDAPSVTMDALKRQQCVWVATTSDEVHLTQGLLEVWQGSQGLRRLRKLECGRLVQSLQD